MNTLPMTVLRDHPITAKMVGLVVADYAILETFMLRVYVSITNVDAHEAMAQFYELRSVNKREELLLEAADHLPQELKLALKKLWRRFKGAANRRTEIAHCGYFDQGDGIKRMRMVRGRPLYEPLSEKLFEHTFSQFRTLGSDILTFGALVQAFYSPEPYAIKSLPLSPSVKGSSEDEGYSDHLFPNKTADLVGSLERLHLTEWLEKQPFPKT